MKVKELIERLKECNPEAEVYTSDYETEIDLWTTGAEGVTLQNADTIYIDEIGENIENSEFK